MAEYIERKRAIVDACNSLELYPSEYAKLENALNKIPAADVEPVKHGRWILEREPDGKPYCFHCSVCDDDFHYIGINCATDYCPNCGARMDLED